MHCFQVDPEKPENSRHPDQDCCLANWTSGLLLVSQGFLNCFSQVLNISCQKWQSSVSKPSLSNFLNCFRNVITFFDFVARMLSTSWVCQIFIFFSNFPQVSSEPIRTVCLRISSNCFLWFFLQSIAIELQRNTFIKIFRTLPLSQSKILFLQDWV